MLVLWVRGSTHNLTPKIWKVELNVHLGYMQVPLSTNFPTKTCLLWVVFSRFDYFWSTTWWTLNSVCHHGVLEGALVKKNDYQNKDMLYNARIQQWQFYRGVEGGGGLLEPPKTCSVPPIRNVLGQYKISLMSSYLELGHARATWKARWRGRRVYSKFIWPAE